MDEKLIVESLSPIEKELLQNLSGEFCSVDKLSGADKQDKTTVVRASGFLKNKGLIETETSEERIAILGIFGVHYLKNQLPERVLLNKLIEKKSILFSEIKNLCNLNVNEAKIALGTLKKKEILKISDGRIFLDSKGANISNKMVEELFLEKLPIGFDSLDKSDKLTFNNLKSRKDLVELEINKKISIRLTDLGKTILKMDLEVDLIEQLTPKIIKQNGWKGKKFRRYDLDSPVPKIYGGKRHFVNQSKDYAKNTWLEMGFKEMQGNVIDTSFWNFDTLFTAQDHPVREMQDTFFIKNLVGKLPEEKIVSKVKMAHEGGIDGSRGWEYSWDDDKSRKIVMRTHTTCLSTRKLKELGESDELPAKYFSIGKAFRNETVDWSHGFEFNQSEGIVIDENANFRQLLGYLKQFARKMGFEKVRFRPAYFPYTEPSLEGDVWNEKKQKWVEVFAAGIFRPEVTEPLLGKPIPVLAWGPGFDRMIMEFYKITDLREMYKNDISKLREMKFWRKN